MYKYLPKKIQIEDFFASNLITTQGSITQNISPPTWSEIAILWSNQDIFSLTNLVKILNMMNINRASVYIQTRSDLKMYENTTDSYNSASFACTLAAWTASSKIPSSYPTKGNPNRVIYYIKDIIRYINDESATSSVSDEDIRRAIYRIYNLFYEDHVFTNTLIEQLLQESISIDITGLPTQDNSEDKWGYIKNVWSNIFNVDYFSKLIDNKISLSSFNYKIGDKNLNQVINMNNYLDTFSDIKYTEMIPGYNGDKTTTYPASRIIVNIVSAIYRIVGVADQQVDKQYALDEAFIWISDIGDTIVAIMNYPPIYNNNNQIISNFHFDICIRYILLIQDTIMAYYNNISSPMIGSTTQGPTTQGPTTQGPTTQGPTTQGPTTQGPTTQGPTTQGPTTQYLPMIGSTF